MYEVNRSVFLLVPLEPFWQWLQSVGTDTSEMSLEGLQADANAYLISPCDNAEQVWDEIGARIEEIFSAELADWCGDESTWPPLDAETFDEWFDIRLSTVLTDLTAEPLAREAFRPLDLG